MPRNSVIVSVDIDGRRQKLPTLSVQLCTVLLLPQPSPQGAEEALRAHLVAPGGEGVVGDVGSVQQSWGLWRERGSINCIFLYEVVRAGIHGHRREGDGFRSILKLLPGCAVWATEA